MLSILLHYNTQINYPIFIFHHKMLKKNIQIVNYKSNYFKNITISNNQHKCYNFQIKFINENVVELTSSEVHDYNLEVYNQFHPYGSTR